MLFSEEDPFELLLRQKTTRGPSKLTHNIRLNLNKLPSDFFPKRPTRRINSHCQRLPPSPFNQFLPCARTLDLRRPRPLNSFSRPLPPPEFKRQFTSDQRWRGQGRKQTEGGEREEAQSFGCTFARRMYSESCEQKRVLLPAVSSRRGRSERQAT